MPALVVEAHEAVPLVAAPRMLGVKQEPIEGRAPVPDDRGKQLRTAASAAMRG
jgi:hypothetical protein